MGESMRGLKRTHYCGEVNESMIGQTVTVMGWVNRRRDLGKLIFIALRDRTGLLQATVDGDKAEEALFQKASGIGREFVVGITGKVISRGENTNQAMKTGMIEVDVEDLRILSAAAVTPFPVGDAAVSNDLRLKYRYLDLRRDTLQKNLMMRHRLTQAIRNYLSEEGFVEVETPVMTASTPEGARDYLVPSRVHPGNFYALPQSPQMFKQLLMVAGFDRYFQVARCFRDEDLRADRQPEFTQIDMELSFVDEEDVITINEGLMAKVFREVMGQELTLPFPRMTYREAMERFGSDKPDIRFGMEIQDISERAGGSSFAMFETVLQAGGSVRGINAKGCGNFSRKQIDALSECVKGTGAKGPAWIAVNGEAEYKTSLSKFFEDDKLKEMVEAFEGEPGDLILLCAGENEAVLNGLGALRLEVAGRLGFTKNPEFAFLWVTEFPLLEWSAEDHRYYAKHHPFTSPMEEDFPLLDSDPGAVRARAYDLVLNGTELGSGSIRIHQPEVQEKMFQTLGFTPEAAKRNFGFIMEAFQYGAPPHGGVAFGIDRIAMLLAGSDSIRDVIAFPKVKDASCPMTGAPGAVDAKQLEELGLKIKG